MSYYRNKLPLKGSVVVAERLRESETCIYVKMPEYSDMNGVIYKSDLPVRAKTHKKALSDMKKSDYLVMIVTNEVKRFNELVELTPKGINPEITPTIITRFKNLNKIVKLIKFITRLSDLDYSDVINKFHDSVIFPLRDYDINDGIDDYSKLYEEYLRYPDKVCEIIFSCLTPVITYDDNFNKVETRVKINKEDILNKVKSAIKEKPSSVSLDFDLTIIESLDKEPVYVLNDFFKDILEKYKDLNIKYCGSPKYQINMKSLDPDTITERIDQIKEYITEWFSGIEDHEINFYEPKIILGEISITYPILYES